MSTTNRCCGSSLQVIPLRAGPDGPVVELLRCRRCSRSHWRSEGADVTRTEALEALGPTAAPQPTPPTEAPTPVAAPAPVAAPVLVATAAAQAPRAARSSSAVATSAAPTRTAELRELLSGWQVLGT